MEVTKSSTLSVPEISISDDLGDTLQLCGCSQRLTQSSLPVADIDLMVTSDSPTASGAWYHVFQVKEPDESFMPALGSCRLRRLTLGYSPSGGNLAQNEGGSASPHRVVMGLHRFFQQAAISCGCLSASILGSPQISDVAFPQALPRWLRSIADDDVSRPLVELEEVNQFTVGMLSSGEGHLRGGIEAHPIVGQFEPGSLPGYVRVPLSMVRVSKYSEPEQLDWDPAERKVQLAVEKFYGPAHADLETT